MVKVAKQAGEGTLTTSKEAVEEATSVFKTAYYKVGSVIDDIDDATKEKLGFVAKLRTKYKL